MLTSVSVLLVLSDLDIPTEYERPRLVSGLAYRT